MERRKFLVLGTSVTGGLCLDRRHRSWTSASAAQFAALPATGARDDPGRGRTHI